MWFEAEKARGRGGGGGEGGVERDGNRSEQGKETGARWGLYDHLLAMSAASSGVCTQKVMSFHGFASVTSVFAIYLWQEGAL